MTIFFENNQFKTGSDTVIEVADIHKYCFEDVEFRGSDNTLGGLMRYLYKNVKFELFFEDYYSAQNNPFPAFRRELKLAQLGQLGTTPQFVAETSHLVFILQKDTCDEDGKSSTYVELSGVTADGFEHPEFPGVLKSLEYYPARHWVNKPMQYQDPNSRMSLIQVFEGMWDALTYSTD